MLSGESDIGTRPKSMNRKLPDEGKDDPILGQSEFPVPGGVKTKAGQECCPELWALDNNWTG